VNKSKLIEELERDEGIVLHAYEDHLGYTTIGIGRLIDKRKGGGITEEEAHYLLLNDIMKVESQLRDSVACYSDLDVTRQRALCNMCFQLGITGLLQFKKMLAAIEKEDWPEAYKQSMDSLWAKQTPERAERVAGIILRGELWNMAN